MVTVKDIACAIERVAPLRWQEDYDNAGLQVGNPEAAVTGILLCTDITEAIVAEAVERKMNLVVAHHPLIFHALKRLTGRDHVERAVAAAIKHDINLYCAHTNMDNAPGGVSWHMAEKLGLTDVEVLDGHDDALGGHVGCGVVGNIAPTAGAELVKRLKLTFEVDAVRCNRYDLNRDITRVALCGGAGSFLTRQAIAAGAQAFVTADMKYHEFMGLDDVILLADIGHYESEHFTTEIFREIIAQVAPQCPVQLAQGAVNPVKYI